MVDATSGDELQTNLETERIIDEQAVLQNRPSAFDLAFLSGREAVTEILLIRHAHQLLDLGGPVGEFADPPLSDLGERQAELVGAALSTRRIDAVYSSPLQRALRTAESIARHHRLEPVMLDDLKEVEVFRDAPPGKTSLEFIGREALAGMRHRFIYEKTWDVYPYSESSAEFRRRVINAIEGIISGHLDKRVAVVCHGGVINSYVGHVIGSKYDMLFRPAHTSVNVVAAGDGIRALYVLNDVHHLNTSEKDFRSV